VHWPQDILGDSVEFVILLDIERVELLSVRVVKIYMPLLVFVTFGLLL
jgi:hypothetical protein